ncbi:MAG: hypothetical protein CMF59_16740 [Leptospiraceae bacterium]|nr:hypothetical protein [Leptospiraceae bacterium]
MNLFVWLSNRLNPPPEPRTRKERRMRPVWNHKVWDKETMVQRAVRCTGKSDSFFRAMSINQIAQHIYQYEDRKK